MTLALLLGQPLAAQLQTNTRNAADSGTQAKWSRVHLPDPVGRKNASKALDLASAWLAEPDCAKALTAFTDEAGQPLAERLSALSMDIQTYLTMVVFVDGSRETPCIRGAFAFTAPGSRVVRMCVDELKRTWAQDPRQVVARVIHEMLHTLGQGEDPPTSAELTRLVTEACGPGQRASNNPLAQR